MFMMDFRSLSCPLEEEHPFLTVFDSANQFWFKFVMVVYEKQERKYEAINLSTNDIAEIYFVMDRSEL